MNRIILGIDPGLANTGWGVIQQNGSRLRCLAYGCISTTSVQDLPDRLLKIFQQISAVVHKYEPQFVAAETVWFGANTSSAFATGQARGAALAACAQHALQLSEFAPTQIKLAIVGTGGAQKVQVQYMVQKILNLHALPQPDHAADALAAAICFTTHTNQDEWGMSA